MNLEFTQDLKKNNSNIRFNENLSNGSGIVPCGRVDRQT
jgi:hypothetical protein